MRETITVNQKEQGRIRVLVEVVGGRMTVGEAAESMNLSVRQTQRILAAFRKEGAAGVAHGNRGRHPVHTIDEEVRRKVVDLVRTTYSRCNDSHLTELLAEREGIVLSRTSVRRIRRNAGLASPRQRRQPAHRVRRARRTTAGQLVQIDGSDHHWFGPDLPRTVLMAGIDDATSEAVSVHFRETEDSQGYLQLLHDLVSTRGRPVALYHDKHQIFVSPDPESIDDQLAGRPPLTQVGRAIAELGIHPIAAHSPQAKGRIERLFGTFQDRLMTELALAGVTTIPDANRFLQTFLPRYNQRFMRAAITPGSAYEPVPETVDLASICCFKYWRTVANDNTVRFQRQLLQLLPGATRISYARARVQVHQHLDGSLAVFVGDERVASQPAPAEPPVLRAKSGRVTEPSSLLQEPEVDAGREELATWHATPPAQTPSRSTPARNHPWRHGFKQKVTQS